MWLGTDQVFEAFKFFVKETEWGVMQIHGYPYSDEGSTFIVEMHEDVWHAAYFDETASEIFPPGVFDEKAIAKIRSIFAEELDGYEVLSNNSKWLNFNTDPAWKDQYITSPGGPLSQVPPLGEVGNYRRFESSRGSGPKRGYCPPVVRFHLSRRS